MRKLLLALLLLAILQPMVVSLARAGAFTVAPTRVLLEGDVDTGVITLRNTGTTASVIQVESYAWTGSSSIAELEPTRDILAVPTVFRLEPGDKQVVRIRARGADGPVERAYRVVLSEVPAPRQAGENGVQFALRLSLPVFATPPGAEGSASWSLDAAPEDGGSLRLANDGTAHLHITELSVTDGSGRELIGLSDGSLYVLAGRAHRFGLPQGRLDGPLRIEAVTNTGEVQVNLDR